MINKEERQLLKAFRKMKKYGAKNLALVDIDTYRINETRQLWQLEDRIKELEEINKEHQKLNGELQKKLTYYEDICKGKSIQELGMSDLYKED